jgi:hypothetical protein
MDRRPAYEELGKFLEKGEIVEAIVFGAYGWDSAQRLPNIENPVPLDKIGVVMSLKEAKPFMMSWAFNGGYGLPDCYAVRIWTNMRVLWVTQYDGSTSLDSCYRNPVNCIPDMPGG